MEKIKINFKYFNDKFNLYFEGEDIPQKENERFIFEENGRYRLTKWANRRMPIYSFGYLTDCMESRPGHRGEWSSNSSQINKKFNTDLIEIAYNGWSCATSKTWLKELLGNKVEWDIWFQDFECIKKTDLTQFEF